MCMLECLQLQRTLSSCTSFRRLPALTWRLRCWLVKASHSLRSPITMALTLKAPVKPVWLARRATWSSMNQSMKRLRNLVKKRKTFLIWLMDWRTQADLAVRYLSPERWKRWMSGCLQPREISTSIKLSSLFDYSQMTYVSLNNLKNGRRMVRRFTTTACRIRLKQSDWCCI